MDVTLSSEQVEICNAARKFLAANCPPAHVRAMMADERGYAPALWKHMAELGWLGLAIGDDHGGLGQSFVDLCLLVEEQGRVLLPGPFLSTAVLGAQAIERFGSAAQQAAHLGAIAEGDCIVAVASGGWNPQQVDVQARRDTRGFSLDGTAYLVDYAGAADVLLVLARCEGALSGFLLPADTPGVKAARSHTVDRGHAFRVQLENAVIAEDAALGRVGNGDALCRALANWGATARCAELVGIGRAVLDMSVDYAKQRVAFGTPIGAFQAVQHHCANMAVDVLSSVAISREAAWRVAVDDDAADESVATAKAWVSDAIARVCALGHQVHGAIGFTAEHDLHLYSKRARAAELAFGDGAWQRHRVATQLGL